MLVIYFSIVWHFSNVGATIVVYWMSNASGLLMNLSAKVAVQATSWALVDTQTNVYTHCECIVNKADCQPAVWHWESFTIGEPATIEMFGEVLEKEKFDRGSGGVVRQRDFCSLCWHVPTTVMIFLFIFQLHIWHSARQNAFIVCFQLMSVDFFRKFRILFGNSKKFRMNSRKVR